MMTGPRGGDGGGRVAPMRCLLLVLLAMCGSFSVGVADPINPLKNPRICGRPDCRSTQLKFRYNNTVEYTYAYRTHVRTEFLGSGQNQSDVYVEATALLTFPQPCEGVLRLRNVKLRDEYVENAAAGQQQQQSDAFDYDFNAEPDETLHPKSEQFALAVERADLRFAYHDGRIDEICLQDEDAAWVMNIKKGLLSVLQNTMRRFDIDYNGTETDVTGTCAVAYTMHGAHGTSLMLHKTKDLSTCTNRYITNSFLQTVPYEFRQNIAVWPILKSTSICNISVDHNIYQEVQCYERHQLEPFSNRESGAVTHSRTHLQLLGERTIAAPKPIVVTYNDDDTEETGIAIRTNLLYDHYPTTKYTHDEIKISRDLLIQMCSVGFPNIQREFIEAFTKFLHTARQLSYKALFQLLTRSASVCGELYKGEYHVIEALPHIGSSASVRIMCEEIVKHRQSGTSKFTSSRHRLPVNKVHNWLSSIAQLHRPDEEMLAALGQLMGYARAHNEPKYVLVATAVAHTYCRHHSACDKSPAIRRIMAFLEDGLKGALLEDVARSRSARERVVLMLKGIRNVGVITSPLLGQLVLELALAGDIPVEFRLQAIYAHTRLDCRRTRDAFARLYEDADENAEVRIAAYQQIMRCPSKHSVKRIKHVLQTEAVNQVGSYVWSSLHNLAKSASPLNVEVQSLLVDEELNARFKLDIRKFSRNFEQSLFFDQYNVGTRFDADLIFGTESFMPRTVGFNITADLFGESVNLFEITTRMEGMEKLAEKTFGPKGPLNSKYVNDKLGAVSKLWSDYFGSDEVKLLEKAHLRFRRSAVNSEDNIPTDRRFANESLLFQLQNAIRATGYSLNYTFDRPHVSVSTKMFGNDIGYHTIDGDDELLAALFAYNPVQQMRSLFSGRQINYTKSGVMLDISYEVPLGAGLPLAIHAFGATSVDLQLSGALKEGDWHRKRLDIEARLKASAALEITATMQTDFSVGAAGIRVKGNMYTSSAVDAALRIENMNLASLQLSLPQDRNEILSATSELLVIKRDVDVPQTGIEPRYANETCTWRFVERAVGLKICAEYSVPDVNGGASGISSSSALQIASPAATNAAANAPVYPSLLLSGPVSLSIHLDKADVSAKKFLFEYRWDDTAARQGIRHGSLSFHTPGSSIVRVFSANVTTDLENYNVTMSFQNGRLKHLASAKYRESENETRLDVFLILDGKKTLACEMGVNRTVVRNGWKYYPLFVMSINDERIAGITGTIKATNKKNIAQYDLDLTFETKKTQAQLTGYITHTELSITPKLTLVYRFLNTRQEFVDVSAELSSRGQKSRIEYTGFMRLNSTAYPNFNFASNMKFTSLLGHVEAKIDFNNARDLLDPAYLLTLRLVFVHTYKSQTGLTRTSATFDVTRPRSNVDFSVQLINEQRTKNGTEFNVHALMRVAPRKQGTVTLSLLLPRSQFFAVDAALNVTVPSFDPFTVQVRWIGTRVNEYSVDVRSTWFTGHSIAATGLYQDISSQVKIHKHLKLLVTSPHFNETNVDMRFLRDEVEISLGVQIEHGSDPYALQMRHSQRPPHPQITSMAVTIIEKVYSIQAQLEKTARQQLLVEIHLDNVRDIHVALRGHSTTVAKEFGIEIQWDANRDPTQMIALSADLNTPHPQHVDGGFVVAYPDRSFSGTIELDMTPAEWTANARVGWSVSESVAVHVIVGSTVLPAKQAWLQVQVNTPFEDWHSSRIRTDLYYYDNLLRTNATLSWGAAQRIAVALATNYVHTETELLGEFRTELNSTVAEVPTAMASFKHHYRGQELNADGSPPHTVLTEMHIRHSRIGAAANVLAVRSAWTLALGRLRLNRTVKGSVRFRSPLVGYRLGGLYAKLALGDDQRLSGACAVDLESNRYRAFADGYAHRIMDSMISLNITTPVERFRHVVCRLGVSDRERHAVAEVRLPSSALGAELLWAVDGLADFDVLFSVETPLEAFQRVRLVGKMRPDTVDMRGVLNRIVLGYVGVWRHASYRDFEYSYRVFTPLENFAENGVVAKCVLSDGIDVEFSGWVAKYKMGIVLNAKPKPALRALVGTQPQQSVYFSAESNGASAEIGEFNDFSGFSESDDQSESDAEEDDDDYETFNYLAEIEVNTIVWPSIVGQLDIDEIEDDYIVEGSLKLPNGVVTIKDRLAIPDYFNVTNTLKLSTPFRQCSDIQIKYVHGIEMGLYYTAGLDLAYRMPQQLVQLGIAANYSKSIEPDLRAHQFQLVLRTPLAQLERIHFSCRVENEDGVYRANITSGTPDTLVTVAGAFESEPNYLDTSFQLQLTAPTVPPLAVHAFVKKTLSDESVDNRFECGLTFSDAMHPETQPPSSTRLLAVWRAEQAQQWRSSVRLQTNLCAVHVLSASAQYDRSTAAPWASAALSITTAAGEQFEYQTSATRNYDLVSVTLQTPAQHWGNVSLHGVLSADTDTPNLYHVQGTCAVNREPDFPMNGTVRLERDVPVGATLDFQRANGAAPVNLAYSLSNPSSGYGRHIDMQLTASEQFVRIDGELSMFSKVNWQLHGSARTSPGFLAADETQEAPEQRIACTASVRPHNDGLIAGQLALDTPWRRLGIDTIRLRSNVSLLAESGALHHETELPLGSTSGRYTWTWIPLRDMQANAVTLIRNARQPARRYELGVKYVDHAAPKSTATAAADSPTAAGTAATPQRLLLGVGVRLNANDLWHLQTNATWRKLPGEIGGTLAVRLPVGAAQNGSHAAAAVDVHKISGQYRGNLEAGLQGNADVNYDLRYETDVTRRRFSSRGQYRNVTDLQGAMRVEWGIDEQRQGAEANVQMLRKETRREFSARVATPFFVTEDTLTASGFYDEQDRERLIKSSFNYPASRQVATTDIRFISFENMKGFANCSTPFKNLTWLHGEFDFSTTGANSNRSLKAIWPTDNASFDLRNTYSSQNLDRDLHGVIQMSVPLASRHTTNIAYGLKDRAHQSTGHCDIEYNGDQVLDGRYTCKYESRAGFDKEVVDITLQNSHTPLGIAYVHVNNYTDEEAGEYDMKRAEVFHLKNHSKFNITGEFHVRKTYTGQEFKLVAVHPSRTPVILTTLYDLQERVTRTHSKLLLADDIWLAYNVVLQNQTNDELESRSARLDLSYPKRNLSTAGWYAQTENTFDSDVTFEWTTDHKSAAANAEQNTYYDYGAPDYGDESGVDDGGVKSVQAALQWRRYPSDAADVRHQTLALHIHHPSFEQNVTFTGEYQRNAVDLMDVKFRTEYCSDPEHLLEVVARVRDLSELVGYRNYTFSVQAAHKATELDLLARGSVAARPGLYETNNEATYRRSYLPVQEGFLIGKVDVLAKEVHFWKTSPHKTFRVWAITDHLYPVYRINASLENSPHTNSTGRFHVNIDDKYVQLTVNMTPDAAQNLQMIGTIPDARSAALNLWRDYEEFRIVDVAYYLRMNHSRLVTSKLVWRPTIRAEVTSLLKETAVQLYESITQNADYWLKTMYSESKESVRDIFEAAKPYTEKFLSDVSGLHALESDLEELRHFVNQSYEANDFYVKSMVNITLTVMDELSLRNHIDSVPKILSELWQLLGDTGLALRKSIVWVMESLKTSYNKAMEMVGRLFKGDAMEHLTELLEKGIAKYDKIVKDLHLSLIKYVQQTWSRFSEAVSNYWQTMLRRIEPTLMQFLHYLESMVWKLSKEMFDFLYKRTNEIVDSPYFHKVSNFTQDIDTLYRDIITHDFITNIRKYGALGWQFLREKYFALVPFGRELNEIVTELVGEVRKLYATEPVQFVGVRLAELQAQITWFANELQVEKRALQLWHIVRQKITTLGQTALQTDDKYREAKTLFVFDPDVGVMELQQKLPMSWHAFNETPIVEEIQEYKTLLGFTSLFQGSNVSLWSLYNDYQQYVHPELWLPPYKANALLIGRKHFMTFDERFVAVDTIDQCAYLLAHDFHSSNLSLVLQPLESDGKKITVVSDEYIFEIVLNGTSVHIANNQPSTLPLAIGDTIIYRDLDVLTVESAKGFTLTCNLRFDVCWFELTGWYFGRTAGIFGNMNNELHDEFRGPLGQAMPSDAAFLRSWSLDRTAEVAAAEEDDSRNVDELAVRTKCDALFYSKLSPFSSCFGIVDTRPYLDMCLDVVIENGDVDVATATPIALCAVSLAYIEACDRKQMPLRVPDVCVNCEMLNGTYVPEGTFVDIGRDGAPGASDTVFIVEAKECNRDVFVGKNLALLVGALQKELLAANLTSNRYAVIGFGGATAPFNTPRSVVHNDAIFTESHTLKYYFDHIRPTPTNHSTTSNTTDILDAISAATKLTFRPGVSKSLVLLPCTPALSVHQQLDYSSVLQRLREDAIPLHVLMDPEFRSDKKRIRQSVFGIDRRHAFTKHTAKDQQRASGGGAAATSQELRPQVGLPKVELGLCAALAMESGGSIFTASKLRALERNPVKKFVAIFARRIVETAAQSRCQTCECTGHNSGMPYMTCTACHRPSSASMDYGLDGGDGDEDEDAYLMRTSSEEEYAMGDDVEDVE